MHNRDEAHQGTVRIGATQWRPRARALSMLLAWLALAVMSEVLIWRVRALVRGDVPVSRLEAIAYGVLLASITGGSIVVYNAALPWVYHEAYAWSMALVVGTLACILGVLRAPDGGLDRPHRTPRVGDDPHARDRWVGVRPRRRGRRRLDSDRATAFRTADARLVGRCRRGRPAAHRRGGELDEIPPSLSDLARRPGVDRGQRACARRGRPTVVGCSSRSSCPRLWSTTSVDRSELADVRRAHQIRGPAVSERPVGAPGYRCRTARAIWQAGIVAEVGVPLSPEECRRRWEPWDPHEVLDRLSEVDAPWGVVAGWAIDLYVGAVTRQHADIEISVPASSFTQVTEALDGFEWDVVGGGRVWPYPATLNRFHQTWLREPRTGRWHLDVFREPHDGDTWLFRRDRSIAVPYDDVYERTPVGVPYLIPELVLLFKAGDADPKDQADFDRVVPLLSAARRARLSTWLAFHHPNHLWLAELG